MEKVIDQIIAPSLGMKYLRKFGKSWIGYQIASYEMV